MKFQTFLLIACSTCNLWAHNQDTLYVADYGIHPNSFESQTQRMQQVISDCKKRHAKVIVFQKGRYDFWPEGAIRKEYFITNTSSEKECPSKEKTLGIFFENMQGITLEGNQAQFIFHGKMTTLALAHSQQIKIKNISIDFQRPGGTEMTYTKVTQKGVEVKVHRDTQYAIIDNHLHLFGEGWRSNKNHCIEYDPNNRHFFYSQGWNILEKSPVSEISPGHLHFSTPADFRPQVGNTLTIRDIIRDQVGLFIYESQDITLENVKIHYMHGLGIVSQYSKNITMNHVICAPREQSGRILASSADFMHFSGCSGKINIKNCQYIGAQDDAINVHGTNLRAIKQINDHSLILQFMHGQSYGYNAFFKGDTIAYVQPTTMQRYAYATVKAIQRLSDRTIQIVLNEKIPPKIALNHDCIENMSCTPEVEIRGCYFTRTSARGTLVTTPRKVIIADNVYEKVGMSGILIEGDAEGWYESGPVNNVRIENNTFIDCTYNGAPGNAMIAINPSNRIINADHPVHRNIHIIGNTFNTQQASILYAKSTQGLVFKNNTIKPLSISEMIQVSPLFILNGCKDVSIKQNTFPKNGMITEKLHTENMKKKYLKMD